MLSSKIMEPTRSREFAVLLFHRAARFIAIVSHHDV